MACLMIRRFPDHRDEPNIYKRVHLEPFAGETLLSLNSVDTAIVAAGKQPMPLNVYMISMTQGRGIKCRKHSKDVSPTGRRKIATLVSGSKGLSRKLVGEALVVSRQARR